ncbi:MAG: GIY-YIG nuclease family protein [Verrucomicrobia bacterium]|nr:GIY-YIG nuclease family protein [Verrucomicrobiota bacterium]
MPLNLQILQGEESKERFYELVYRRFARSHVHEITYSLGRDGKLTSWRGHDSVGWPKELNLAECLSFGWPMAEAGGTIREVLNMVLKRIYVDDLFLCPECASFHRPQNDAGTLQLNELEKNPFQFFQSIESRASVKEFSHKVCPEINLCQLRRELGQKAYRKMQLEVAGSPSKSVELPKTPKSVVHPQAGTAEDKIYRPLQSVYLIEGNNFFKIGIALDVLRRLRSMRTSTPFELTVVKVWKSTRASEVERLLHEKFKDHRVRGEWFQLPKAKIDELLLVSNLDDLLPPEDG